MPKNKSMRWAGLCAVLAAALVLAASSWLAGQKYEKICPITFRLYPGTLLESSCAARVEKDNAKLSTFLGVLRGAVPDDAAARKTFDPAKWYGEYRKTMGAVDPFAGTYLANDLKLTKEDGTTVEGLSAVLAELTRIIADSTYVDAQSVHVYLEYLPYGSPEFRAANTKYETKSADQEIDIIAHIKTVLAYAPYDDPVTIEGALPHRKICFDY